MYNSFKKVAITLILAVAFIIFCAFAANAAPHINERQNIRQNLSVGGFVKSEVICVDGMMFVRTIAFVRGQVHTTMQQVYHTGKARTGLDASNIALPKPCK